MFGVISVITQSGAIRETDRTAERLQVLTPRRPALNPNTPPTPLRLWAVLLARRSNAPTRNPSALNRRTARVFRTAYPVIAQVFGDAHSRFVNKARVQQ